jgi:glycosyltransferase involved in cell wall biosynthesis
MSEKIRTQPRRLCMVVHAAYPLDVRVAREVRVALADGWEVDIFAMRREAEPRWERLNGARVIRVPLSHRRGAGVLGVLWEYVGFTVLASLGVAWRALRARYDLVQVHNPPDFLIAAALVPRLVGARVIFDIHDLSPDMFAMRFEGRPGTPLADRLLRAIERMAARFADAVITVHEPYRRELISRGVRAAKTTVVMNSLDEELLPEADGRENGNGFRIVYHGTITPPYGVHLVIEAAAELASEIEDLSVEIYGEGDSLPVIEACSRELDIATRVYFSRRYLPQAEVLACVRAASVGVIPNLPTRLNRFALSSKLFEYVALGVPVVCSDLPTIREHFSDDEVLFFRAGDRSSLTDALRAVAQDPAAASARVRAAQHRYKEYYSWKVNASRYVDVLTSLATARGPSAGSCEDG